MSKLEMLSAAVDVTESRQEFPIVVGRNEERLGQDNSDSAGTTNVEDNKEITAAGINDLRLLRPQLRGAHERLSSLCPLL